MLARWSERLLVLAFFAVCAIITVHGVPLVPTSPSPSSNPPIYRIRAESPYDAGRQHGVLAKSHLVGWFATDELQAVFQWVTTDATGNATLTSLMDVNRRTFPRLAEELQGIADGAGVPVWKVWVTNMVEELETIRSDVTGRNRPADHCSDFGFTSVTGRSVLGHNEDWSIATKPFWYFLATTPAHDAARSHGVQSCAGMVYPGCVVGNAAAWNEHGLFGTQNMLFPIKASANGVSSTLLQNEAICQAHSLDDAVATLTDDRHGEWSTGASMNLIDVHTGHVANVETHLRVSNVLRVQHGGNYSHFNQYKRKPDIGIDHVDESSVHRQARANQLSAPTRPRDILALLSDSTDTDYPIYRNSTLATLVVDSAAGTIDVWVDVPATSSDPTMSWDLHHFFVDEAAQ